MREKIETTLWQALQHLRGEGEPSDQVGYLFRLLTLKLVSDLAEDEHRHGPPPFQVPAEARWARLLEQNEEMGAAVDEACRHLEEANPSLKRALSGRSFTYIGLYTPEGYRVLTQLVRHLAQLPRFTSERVASGALGEACEGILLQFGEEFGRHMPSFHTPPSITQLMVELMGLRPGMRVCDPVCGVGSFLTACARQVMHPGDDESGLSSALALYGQERNLEPWALCRMNLMLHGIFNARIELGDVIRAPLLLDERGLLHYDRILADPPYNMEDWGAETARADPFKRFEPAPSRKAADYAFIQHILATLEDEGRAAILTLRSTLFRSGDEEKRIRRALVEQDQVEAVIALPGNLYAMASIAPVVLVLRRGKEPARRGRVLCIDASRLGVTQKRQRALSSQDVQAIARTFHAFEETAGFSRAASQDEIAANGWNLNVALYVKQVVQEYRLPLEQQLMELAEIENERDEAARRMEELLENLKRTRPHLFS